MYILIYNIYLYIERDFPGGSDGKSICLHCRIPQFDPWFGKILWRRKWQPTPVFFPGKSHGQRSLVGYSPWGSQRVKHDWCDLACMHVFFKCIIFLGAAITIYDKLPTITQFWKSAIWNQHVVQANPNPLRLWVKSFLKFSVCWRM